MTPLQCARFMVYSFPHAADLLSLMTCAAYEAGEPSTHDLLRAAVSARRDKDGASAASSIQPPLDGGLPPSPRERAGCI